MKRGWLLACLYIQFALTLIGLVMLTYAYKYMMLEFTEDDIRNRITSEYYPQSRVQEAISRRFEASMPVRIALVGAGFLGCALGQTVVCIILYYLIFPGQKERRNLATDQFVHVNPLTLP